jgi:addiction module HigA family antidote
MLETGNMKAKFVPAIHPGEILREEYLAPLGMSAGALARKLHVPRTRIERIATEQAPITTNTALRLAKFFDTTPEFWMSMQTAYDLSQEAETLASELAEIESLQAA